MYDTYVSEKIPTGCVLLDGNQNKIDPDENGIYELPLVGKSSQKFTNTKDIGTRGYGDYYIGYPKEIYNGQTVTETTEWIGKIQDSYYKRGAEKQAKVLVTKDTTVNVNDYEVVVKETYSLGKSTFASQRSYHKITNSKYGENIEYSFSLGASYLGEKYTLKCGDDLVYITDADGNPRQLNDDEYYFKSVAIEGDQWRNGNGTIIEYEKYDMQLFVRYKNTEDYVPYGNMMKNNSNLTIKFSENNVVRLVYRSI